MKVKAKDLKPGDKIHLPGYATWTGNKVTMVNVLPTGDVEIYWAKENVDYTATGYSVFLPNTEMEVAE